MKPVVCSLVALVFAIAPMTAMAKPAQPKAAHAKVVKKHHKADSAQAAEEEKSDKPIVAVKTGKKDGSAVKSAVHHAQNVDLAGPGHKEPKVEKGGAIVPASMTTKTDRAKSAHAKQGAKASEMPKLPNPNAGKPSKGGAEKGARKPAEKKHEAASDANDGEPTRDEEFAELVARIRGRSSVPEGYEDSAKAEPRGTRERPKDDHATEVGRQPEGMKAAKTIAHTSSQPPCTKDPVEIIRGPEVERLDLMKCDGTLAPLAVERLSILIRPGGAERPTAPVAELAKKPGAEIAHGIRRVDRRLVDRIQSLAERFGAPGAPAKLSIISGYRPASVGSMHGTGRAVDFRVEGVKNEDVVAFCRTLADTGCGYYPNSSFVHVDVRDAGAGHLSWIDASGPGESPRYVSTWPPPSSPLERVGAVESISQAELAEQGANILRARRPFSAGATDRETPPDAVDEHPAEIAP